VAKLFEHLHIKKLNLKISSADADAVASPVTRTERVHKEKGNFAAEHCLMLVFAGGHRWL
jgi:hypothetical protein